MSGSRPRERRAEATAVLEAETASILGFEAFLDGIPFLSSRERSRLKIAGGEIFDNIVKHAAPLRGSPLRGAPPLGGRIVARAARRREGGEILLGFYFRSPSFGAEAAQAARAASEPLFDQAAHRWRGIGLVMCRNLARSLVFRPGEALDRIYLEFDPD